MYKEFIIKLKIALKKNLPGTEAQKLMAPLGRSPLGDFVQEAHTKNSAVLLLLYPNKLAFPTTVLIIRQNNEPSNHSGQISLPGGGYDTVDQDLSETALRETGEEIGVSKKSITLLGQLSPLYIPISNYLVYPYIGYCDAHPIFHIQPKEVEELLECTLEELFSPSHKGFELRDIKIQNTTMKVPCYKIRDKIIWGATAMILSEFEQILRGLKK